jgi:glucose/arabinose dehydrogenase
MHRILAVATTVVIAAAPVARAHYAFNAFPDLPAFSAPMGVVDPFDGTDRLFVPERAGLIYAFNNDPTVSTRTLFLDISGLLTTSTEGGLLGLAFHPDYETNRYFYVTYTAESPRREVLARYTADPTNPNSALPASALVILEVAKTQLFHNGGQIVFGADGYLYWSLGEDGAAHLAQDLDSLHGKLLRIDVDNPSGGNNYGIPPDNPFLGISGRDEIWAFGFRNPWRFSFDPPTGRLWLADVGQDSWEEINIVRKGRNYGWPRMEGNECFMPQPCDTNGLNVVPPLYAYPHVGGASVTGGFVYRGSRLPSLVGKYVYADFITDQVWALSWDGVNPPVNQTLLSQFNVPSFGVDKDNELFLVSFDGNLYELFMTPTPVQTPAATSVLSIAPNPFQATTAVSFTLPSPADATLEVFDVAGRRVAMILDGSLGGGPALVRWDGRDEMGRALRSGVYFVRLTLNGEAVETRRITFLK